MIPVYYSGAKHIQPVSTLPGAKHYFTRDQGLMDGDFKTPVNVQTNFRTMIDADDLRKIDGPTPEDAETEKELLARIFLDRIRKPGKKTKMIYDTQDENLSPQMVKILQREILLEPSKDTVDLVRQSNLSALNERFLYQPRGEQLQKALTSKQLKSMGIPDFLSAPAAGLAPIVRGTAMMEGSRFAFDPVRFGREAVDEIVREAPRESEAARIARAAGSEFRGRRDEL